MTVVTNSKMNDMILFKNGISRETHFLNGITCNLTNYGLLESSNEFHSHTNAHISFILEGNYIENRKKQVYYRQNGEIFFCNSYESHKFETKNNFKKLNIELTDQFLKAYNIKESQIENRLIISTNTKSNILKILFELQQRDENMETSITFLLLDMLTPNIQETKAVIPKWFYTLEELISDKWNEKITLIEVSETLNIHPVTISKYFSKYSGYTFGEYSRRIKTNKSIDLIRNTSLSITEIAYQCGFSDQSHFIRTFKNLNGFTPKQFQNY